jgi:hypothetical protein
MAAKVAAFRHGLDVDELTKSVSMGKAETGFHKTRRAFHRFSDEVGRSMVEGSWAH